MNPNRTHIASTGKDPTATAAELEVAEEEILQLIKHAKKIKCQWSLAVSLIVYVDSRTIRDAQARRIYDWVVRIVSGLKPIAVVEGPANKYGYELVENFVIDGLWIVRRTWQAAPGCNWQEEEIVVARIPQDLMQALHTVNDKLKELQVSVGEDKVNAVLIEIADYVYSELIKRTNVKQVERWMRIGQWSASVWVAEIDEYMVKLSCVFESQSIKNFRVIVEPI